MASDIEAVAKSIQTLTRQYRTLHEKCRGLISELDGHTSSVLHHIDKIKKKLGGLEEPVHNLPGVGHRPHREPVLAHVLRGVCDQVQGAAGLLHVPRPGAVDPEDLPGLAAGLSRFLF